MKKYDDHTAIYIGKRILGNDVAQCFERTDTKEILKFKRIKSVYIGSTYKCGENGILVSPERVDVETIENPKWEAENAIAEEYLWRKRAQTKVESTLKKEEKRHLKTAIEALRPLVKSVDYDYFKIERLMHAIGQKLWDEKWKRKKK